MCRRISRAGSLWDWKALCVLLAAGFLRAQTPDGFHCRILFERVDHSLVAVPSLHEFHSGDRIWLRVGLSAPAYIYVLNKTEADFMLEPSALHPKGSWPTSPLPDLPHLILGPRHLSVGETDLPALTFDDSTGIEKLYVVFVSHPLDRDALVNVGADVNRPAVIRIALRHRN